MANPKIVNSYTVFGQKFTAQNIADTLYNVIV